MRHNKEFMPFHDAKDIIKSLGFRNSAQYRQWVQVNGKGRFPSDPALYYRGAGWESWGDFLGTGFVSTQRKTFLSFEEAKAKVRELGIPDCTAYHKWTKENKNSGLPTNPHVIYNEWVNWFDFLGARASRKKRHIPFIEAVKIVRKAGIKSHREFVDWVQENKDKKIPTNPHLAYKGLWKSWGDFLGTGSVASMKKRFLTYEDARNKIQAEGVTNKTQFTRWVAQHKNEGIPVHPNIVYDKDWVSWPAFCRSEE